MWRLVDEKEMSSKYQKRKEGRKRKNGKPKVNKCKCDRQEEKLDKSIV